jgi:hypothetical protein
MKGSIGNRIKLKASLLSKKRNKFEEMKLRWRFKKEKGAMEVYLKEETCECLE